MQNFKLLQHSLLYFGLGLVVHFFSWSPILCRIFRAMFRYPEEFPVPVWVGTFGIFFLYMSFVFAHATSIVKVAGTYVYYVTRDSNKDVQRNSSTGSDTSSTAGSDSLTTMPSTEQSDTSQEAWSRAKTAWTLLNCQFVSKLNLPKKACWYICHAVCFPQWKQIALLTVAGVGNLLSVIILYFPDQRNKFFGEEDAKQSEAEGFALMSALFLAVLINLIVLVVTEKYMNNNLVESMLTKFINKLIQPVLVASSGFAFYYVWGNLVSSSIVKDAKAWQWGLVVVLVLTVLDILLFLDYCYGWKFKQTSVATKTIVVDKDKLKATNTKLYSQLLNGHLYAAIFHMLLTLFAMCIGLVKYSTSFTDWYENWILVHENMFLMLPDWDIYQNISDFNQTEKCQLVTCDEFERVELSYCAPEHSIGVYFILLSIGWSLMSAVQHLYSVKTMADALRGHKTQLRKLWNANMIVFGPLLLISNVLVYMTFEAKLVNILAAFVFAVFVQSCISIVVLCSQQACMTTSDECQQAIAQASSSDVTRQRLIALPAMRSTASLPKPEITKQDLLYDALNACRKAKWWEYLFSASLMHITLMHNMGIIGVHEIASTVLLFGISMLMALKSEKYLIKIETKVRRTSRVLLDIHEIAQLELPYIFLSFFSKGLLDVSYTLPALFIEDASYSVVPNQCTI